MVTSGVRGLIALAEHVKEGGVLSPRVPYEVLTTTLAATTAVLAKSDLQAGLKGSGIELEKNPAFHPFLEIVQDGVAEYMRTHQTTGYITWNPEKPYMSIDTFVGVLNAPFKMSSGVGYVDRKLLSQLQGKTNAEAIAFFLSHTDLTHISGSLTYIISDMMDSENVSSSITSRITKSAGTLIDTTDINAMFRVIDYIESQSGIDQQPVSGSYILAKCLEQTDGDLAWALQLMAETYKYMARGDGGRVDDEDPRSTNTALTSSVVLDEYSRFLPSFNTLDGGLGRVMIPKGVLKDFNAKLSGTPVANFMVGDRATVTPKDTESYYDMSLDNRVGAAYHTAYLVSLLDTFSPEFIFMMVLAEYRTYGHLHGVVKFLADMDVLKDLYKIKDYLQHFSTKESS